MYQCIEVICIKRIENRYYKFEVGKKYKCHININLSEEIFIFNKMFYGFKKDEFDKNFLNLKDYRNKKLESIL